MLIDASQQKYLVEFNKYARFIGDHFGIEVQFDGAEACTDGKVIKLPNVAGLAKKEIDFLYGILLHEVGHIRYSTFSPESFAMLKTENHAHLANAIEDARIENLLIKDFDGAAGIFHQLYAEHSVDPILMNKVFGVDLKSMSVFHAVGVYTHQRIIKLKNLVPFAQLVPKKVSAKIIDFVEKENINSLIDTSPLKDWNDVVELTNHIYTKFTKHFLDKSEPVKIQAQQKAINSAQESVLKSGAKINQQIDDLKALNNEIKTIKTQLATQKVKINEEKNQLRQELEKKTKVLDKLDETLANREYEKALSERIAKLGEKNSSLEEKLKNYKAREEKLNETIKSSESVDAENSTTDEKLAKKQASLKERLEKVEAKNKQVQEKIDFLTKELTQTREELTKNSDLVPKSNEELSTAQKQLAEEVKALSEKLSESEKKSDLDKELANLKARSDQMKKEMSQDLIEQLKAMQASLDKNSVEAQLLPQFQPTPGWEEADQVQQEWDQMAGAVSNNLVNNGAGLNLSNVRDLILEIERASNALQSIDLAAQFKVKNNMSKLISFNEVVSSIHNTDAAENEHFFKGSTRHVPVTTKYDVVVKKVTSSRTKQIDQIRAKNSALIRQVKEEFRRKLRFARKDHYKGGQEDGQLDARNLWKLASRMDNDFYEINNPKHINKVVASIAVDISGSMDKDVTENGEKLRELSLLLSEGLSSSFIQHEIVGYHAPVNPKMREIKAVGAYNRRSHNLETVIYREFNDKSYRGLENLEIKSSDNSDGESLRLVAQRLMKQNSRQKVIFLITDGKPFLSDANVALLDQDMREAIEMLAKQKIKLYVLGFNDKPKAFFGDNYFKFKKSEDILTFIRSKL